MQALAQSKAVETALSQIMSLPEPLTMEQRLATFLEALMHGQAPRPAKLASAIVGIAAAARKDGSQASYTSVLLISVLLWKDGVIVLLISVLLRKSLCSTQHLCVPRLIDRQDAWYGHSSLDDGITPTDISLPLLQEFGKDAQHALHTVGLTLRHMVTQSAASQASKDRSEDDAHLAQQCSSKEAALEKAQTAE